MKLSNIDFKKHYPILLIMAGIMIFFILLISKPKSTPEPLQVIKPMVEVEKIYLEDIIVRVQSHGFMSPETESQIYPEISGEIIDISFKDGTAFEKGDILLQIDPTDYELALKSAESNLAQAQLQLSIESAESELAKKEWNKIGEGEASELTLRTPQLNKAIAVVEAAEALLQQSKRNLDKTQIKAPYDGIVRKMNVDKGTVVVPGYLIASIYAKDYFEVKLPIPDRELAYIEIPFDGRKISVNEQPNVVLRGLFGGDNVVWNGKIVRLEADLDVKSRMATLVARVDNPYKNKIPPKYQDVFGDTIIELAKDNDNIVGVTPAMLSGSSLNRMMDEMPNRVFDVGIAEQHAVTFSAGLATQGILPFCNIYSTFMQRAYDQVIHDVALQNLDVIFCLDRGGFVGADGATHHGVFDLAYFRCIPNMIVSSPMNEQELRNLMYTAQLPNKGPFSIRYPRGNGVIIDWETPFEEIEIGKGRMVKDGEEIAILSIGNTGNFVVESQNSFDKEGLAIAHFDMRFVKPIDKDLLHTIFQKFDKIITIEDGCLQGGFGSSVIEFMADNKYKSEVVRLGIPDEFINHGTQEDLYAECCFDVKSIKETVYKLISRKAQVV